MITEEVKLKSIVMGSYVCGYISLLVDLTNGVQYNVPQELVPDHLRAPNTVVWVTRLGNRIVRVEPWTKE